MIKRDDRNAENYSTRIAANRRECFPAISAEEDEEIAAKTGRARKVERCPKCARNIYIARGCWYCRTRFRA